MNGYVRLAPTYLLAASLFACSTPQVDPVTGDAIVTEEEAGLFSRAAVSPDSAIRLAKNAVPGRVTKAELEHEGGVLLYSFDIEVDGERGVTEIHVDAATGAMISKEHEGD